MIAGLVVLSATWWLTTAAFIAVGQPGVLRRLGGCPAGRTVTARQARQRPGGGYPNTLAVSGIGFAPPSGATADAWDALRAEHPNLDGARVFTSGPLLHVQVEQPMGSPGWRVALVGVIAEVYHAEPKVTPVTRDDGEGYVTWALFTYRGQRVCLETSVCSCHPMRPEPVRHG